MITFDNVWAGYGGEPVIKGVSLHCPAARITALVGPSGGGKSTLLRLLMGFVHPDKGQISIDGRDVSGFGEREWRAHRRNMGMLFQHSALFDSLTVLQNVGFYPYYIEKQPWRVVRKEAMELLGSLGLAAAADKLPAELSGGMQRRAALARSLIYSPRLMLYDEPTSGLDPANTELVTRLIRETHEREGMTSVVVTHDLQCIKGVADRVVLISGGIAHEAGSVREFLASEKPEVADFTSLWRGHGAVWLDVKT
jgi:phospholipid/cholesterol/gamma-HCH transport system ATP-binding protein